MCQINKPPVGREASNQFRCRFSTRKYSLPDPPSFHKRKTLFESLTSGILTVPFVVRLSTETQPCFALHPADGCTGVSPPPPQLPPAIKHQFPIPSELPSVS